MVHEDRIRDDLQALKNTDAWGEVKLVRSDRLRGILIKDFPYPQDWQPRRGDFLLDIPDSYPREPPDVYIPRSMEYTGDGSFTRRRYRGSTSQWWKFCHERTDWAGQPGELGTFIATIRDSLSQPDTHTPYHDADTYDPETGEQSTTGLLGKLLGGDTA